MKFYFLFLFLFVFSNYLGSQVIPEPKFKSIESERLEYLINQAKTNYENGLIDSSLELYEEAFFIAQQSNYTEELCLILKEIGILHDLKGNYPKALEYLYSALEIASDKNYIEQEASININLGIVYFNLRKTDKAIENYNRALVLSEQINDTLLIIKSYNNLGNVYLSLLKEWDKAEYYFNKSVELSRRISFEHAIVVGLNNLCQVYMNSNRDNEAFEVSKQMMEISPENPYIYYNIGNLYRQNNELHKAIDTYIKSLDFSYNETELKQILLKDISEVYVELGIYDKAYAYSQEYYNLKDSIHSIEQLRLSEEIEAQYKNLENEKEITELTNRTLISSRKINIIIFISVIMGLVALMLIIFINNKKRIVKQKLIQSENEKIIIAAFAVLDGEEKERKRLAVDLHDGLGGILSAVKLGIEQNNLTTKNKENKTLELITKSITELRRISNALLPETLLNCGLRSALESYCTSFNSQSSILHIDFKFYGIEKRFGKQFELSTYRIFQELLNNAIKHSEASIINIELIIDDNRLFLCVSENGKGFEKEDLLTHTGLGMMSIRQRTEIYGGRFEINSSKGEGTEAIIEFDNLDSNKLVYDKTINN